MKKNAFETYSGGRGVDIIFNDITLMRIQVANLISVGEREIVYRKEESLSKGVINIKFTDLKVIVFEEQLEDDIWALHMIGQL